jgi:hypothetical protein
VLPSAFASHSKIRSVSLACFDLFTLTFMEGYQPLSASAPDMPYTDQTYIPEKPLMMQAYTEAYSVPVPINSGQEPSRDASCPGSSIVTNGVKASAQPQAKAENLLYPPISSFSPFQSGHFMKPGPTTLEEAASPGREEINPLSHNLGMDSPDVGQTSEDGKTFATASHYDVTIPQCSYLTSFQDRSYYMTSQEQLLSYDILHPNQRGGKRGPFKDPNLREQTAQTRKMGSCIRCRMQRIRVSIFCIFNPSTSVKLRV